MDVPQFIAGRFRIERELGTGGMGTVYLATHLDLERPVAVKIIKPEFATDTDVAERFLREARTMAKLRHPHAAIIFDAGNLPDGRHFIVMEFVEGETLSQALAREGRFSFTQAVNIATQICDVLEEAHRLGITSVHHIGARSKADLQYVAEHRNEVAAIKNSVDEVLSHIGARPQASLSELAGKAGLG